MKKRISDMMDCMEYADLELNQETPLSSQRIKELTMNKITNNRNKRRTGYRVLVAAAVIVALTATVLAAGNISGWFRQYFEKQTDVPLTPEQIEFIEENEQFVEDKQEQNGWTVELKSAIGSGRITYITLGITAPEDVNLTDWETFSLKGFYLTDGQGNAPYTWYIITLDDLDGFDHTCDILMVAEPREANNTGYWNIQIDALYGSIYDRAYELELLRTKYASQTEFTGFTSEELARIDQKTLLAEGPWNFIVAVPDSGLTEIELVTEPVKSGVLYEVKDSINHISEPVTVTSFLLRPLDASLYYEFSSKDSTLGLPVMFTGTHATAIMNDGTQIALRGSFGSRDGELKLLADAPIVLEEVDYVILSDGTKLMMP